MKILSQLFQYTIICMTVTAVSLTQSGKLHAADEEKNNLPPPNLATPPEVVTAAQIAALPPHPRIFADPEHWKQLRVQIKSDPASAEIFGIIHQRADSMLDAPAINYAADPANILLAVREAERMILTLAMSYRLSDDARYLVATRRVMQSLLDVPWPRGHFLDTAEATFAMSIAYDWLYEQLTSKEREAIVEKIYQQALVATTIEEDKFGWIWADNNWNQVCNGGLVVGALAIAERNPVLARRIINRSLAFLPRAAATYAPVGVYPEGPTYWGFGTTYHLIQLEAYRSALGSSLDLEKFPGFLSAAECLDQITSPTGKFFNHADNRDHRGYSAGSLWFARENKRPDLALSELMRLREGRDKPNPEDTRDLPLFLLWWTPLPDPIPNVAEAPLHWRGESSQPIAVLRSAWKNPDATWLAIKGGTANHSHAHMDAGSFVMEALGVRWAVDPVRDDYSLLRAGGYAQSEIFNSAQDSKRWAVFRLGAEAHNILRFDGALQNISGNAAVSLITESKDGASVEVDLASTYKGQATAVRRRVTLHPDTSVTLTDTWTTLDQPTEVTWQWLTEAEASTDAEGVLLKQDGKTLRLKIEGADQFHIEIQPVAPLLNSKIDSPAPDLKRVLVHLPTAAKTTTNITIQLIPNPKLTK